MSAETVAPDHEAAAEIAKDRLARHSAGCSCCVLARAYLSLRPVVQPKCPNPNCENGLIKGTGVGCCICEGLPPMPARSPQFRAVVNALRLEPNDRLPIINAALWDIREKNPHANVVEVAEAVDCALAAWEDEALAYTRSDLEGVAREALDFNNPHGQRHEEIAAEVVTRYLASRTQAERGGQK